MRQTFFIKRTMDGRKVWVTRKGRHGTVRINASRKTIRSSKEHALGGSTRDGWTDDSRDRGWVTSNSDCQRTPSTASQARHPPEGSRVVAAKTVFMRHARSTTAASWKARSPSRLQSVCWWKVLSLVGGRCGCCRGLDEADALLSVRFNRSWLRVKRALS